MSLFVWLLPFDLSGLGVPASSYATASIALGVTEALKFPHHVKVETPSGERRNLRVNSFSGTDIMSKTLEANPSLLLWSTKIVWFEFLALLGLLDT